MSSSWALDDRRQLATIARNVTTRYLTIANEIILGFVMLPFNLRHLGVEAYGLWVLTSSLTIYFSVLDLGFGGAMVKFVAHYRAHRDTRALNEIASTVFFLWAAIGVIAYGIVVALAFNLDHIFHITPEQAQTGKWILLVIGLNVALNFPFSVFGGVLNGFQRYDANNGVAIVNSVLVAVVNAAVLLAGYGLIALVIATTAVRISAYWLYRRNAYRIYPALSIRVSLFHRSRLREVTGFSVYAAIIDWANKLNYQLDAIVIGVFMGSAPVAVWAVADRLIAGTQRLTNQLNGILFPVVVDCDATQRTERLQTLMLEGTRLSLAMVAPIAAILILLAQPLVRAWVGVKMLGSVPVIQILAIAVALRVGNATGTTVLKGAGSVRYLAVVNIITGLVNLALSALLIKPLGLTGVALGTLIPIAGASIFVLFPAACRRVGLPVVRVARDAVWPAIWPAVIVGVALAPLRQIASGTLLAVLIEATAAIAAYLALFFLVAVAPRDRAQYVAKVSELIGRRRHLAPAV